MPLSFPFGVTLDHDVSPVSELHWLIGFKKVNIPLLTISNHFSRIYLFGNVGCSSKIYRRLEVGACALLCVYHSLRFARLLSSASLPRLTDSLLHSRTLPTTLTTPLLLPPPPSNSISKSPSSPYIPPLQFLFLVVFLRCCCFAGSQVPYPPQFPFAFRSWNASVYLDLTHPPVPLFLLSPLTPPAIIPMLALIQFRCPDFSPSRRLYYVYLWHLGCSWYLVLAHRW
jgi:hypothetical protein